MATINIGYVTVSWMTSLVHTVATKKFSQDTTHLKFAILKKWKSGTNNYLLAYPDSILSSYNKIIWWNCPKNHQYSMSLKKKLYYRMRGFAEAIISKNETTVYASTIERLLPICVPSYFSPNKIVSAIRRIARAASKITCSPCDSYLKNIYGLHQCITDL